jgi:hypothetical protein
MSEQSSNYDPMSFHTSVDEIYSSPEMVEHARLMRSISQEATRQRLQKEARRQKVVNLHIPELFGSREPVDPSDLPVAPPTNLNNDTAAENMLPVVDNR